MSAEPARLRDNRVLQGTAIASAFLILLGLGTWQMERLRWKESLLADITARAGATPVPAPDTASDLPGPGRASPAPTCSRRSCVRVLRQFW